MSDSRGCLDYEAHGKAIDEVLAGLNRESDNPYILKGGTALLKCYGLDRFSEDIDLDSERHNVSPHRFERAIETVAYQQGYTYRMTKQTPTVHRAFLVYEDPATPLKIELSMRKRNVNPDTFTTVNGTKVYTINELAQQKAAAYLSRDKIRDLFDLTFIVCEKYDDLTSESIETLARAFEYKDVEQFDYMIETQEDPLIDSGKLEDRFLKTLDRLGLIQDAPAKSKTDALKLMEQKKESIMNLNTWKSDVPQMGRSMHR
jgi:predicted nucleotidyltransferase component of viral defense system